MNTTKLYTYAFAVACALSVGCDLEPAKGSVVNAFAADSSSTIVKVWYRTTLFTTALRPGEESPQKPLGTGDEPAYALIALDYEPDGGTSSRHIVVRTKDAMSTKDDGQVKLTFSPTTATGPCSGSPPLAQEEYDSIAQRIFPGDTVQPLDGIVCSATPHAP